MQTKRLIPLIIAALIVYATLSLFAAQQALRDSQELTQELTQTLRTARCENEALRKSAELRNDPAHLEEEARLRLGLVKPDDIIFIFR